MAKSISLAAMNSNAICFGKNWRISPFMFSLAPRALCATAPNELFSWDITYLPTLVIGVYFYLYLFTDIFSRKIVGWQIYETESSELAGEVMRDICEREHIARSQVVLHSDNGSPMKGATMLATLQPLG
jgi:putative transposase